MSKADDELLAAIMKGDDDPIHGGKAAHPAGVAKPNATTAGSTTGGASGETAGSAEPPSSSSLGQDVNATSFVPSPQQPHRGAPKTMDTTNLLAAYDPYGYKAFSPSAVPPSPAMLGASENNTPMNLARIPGMIPQGGGGGGAPIPTVPVTSPSPGLMAGANGGGIQPGTSTWGTGTGGYPMQMGQQQQAMMSHQQQPQANNLSGVGLAGGVTEQQYQMMAQALVQQQQQQALFGRGGGATSFNPANNVNFYDSPTGASGGSGGNGGGRGRGGRGRGEGRGRGGNQQQQQQHPMNSGPSHGSADGDLPAHIQARRSPAMQDFHASESSWDLSQTFTMMDEFCKDQEGSRFLQRKLDEATPAMIIQVFEKIVDAGLEDIVGDVFGNYVVQKIVEVGDASVRDVIARHLEGKVIALTLQTYGCRVVQRCIELMTQPHREMIYRELEGNVARCVQDQNGNHVIQKVVEVDPNRSGFIVDSFRGMVKELATHAYGCRVIQCVLQYHLQSENAILAEMQPCAEMLATDQFGNYVMQHVIQHCHSSSAADIVALLTGHFYPYANHKFASNVMEKLYKRAGVEMREIILHQLMMPCDDPNQIHEVAGLFQSQAEAETTPQISFLYCLIKDRFGNYVMQAMVDTATDAQRERIMNHVRPYHTLLRRYTYGKHIVTRLERLANGGETYPGGRGSERGGRGRGGGRGGFRGGSNQMRGGGGGGGGGGGNPYHQQQQQQQQQQGYPQQQLPNDYVSPSKEQAW